MKRRLLCVVSIPPPVGGAAIMNENTIKIFRKNGYEVVHINPRFPKDEADREQPRLRKLVELARVMIAILFCLSFHRINKIYYALSGNRFAFIKDFILLYVPLVLQTPVILHLHLSNLTEFYGRSGYIVKRMFRFIVSRNTLFLVLSENLKEKFRDIIPMQKMMVVSNGICAPQITAKRSYDKEELVCLHLGILHRNKGIFTVVEAAQHIKERNIKFYIVGPPGLGFDEHETAEFLTRAGLENTVFFLGPKYDQSKDEIYSRSDIFVFPTLMKSEGIPLVLLEAMSHGLCLLAPPIGAIPEIIKDGQNGFILKSLDPTEIADRISFLNKDREKLKQISLNNVNTFKEKYSIERYEQRILECMNQDGMMEA
jgi:glycosyltransferase involved in cell wall biosynthesis